MVIQDLFIDDLFIAVLLLSRSPRVGRERRVGLEAKLSLKSVITQPTQGYADRFNRFRLLLHFSRSFYEETIKNKK